MDCSRSRSPFWEELPGHSAHLSHLSPKGQVDNESGVVLKEVVGLGALSTSSFGAALEQTLRHVQRHVHQCLLATRFAGIF